MKKNQNKKGIVILFTFLISMVLLSVFMHFMKYSEQEWLKYFDNIDGLKKISNFSFWWYISTSELYGAIMYVFPILLIIISSYNIFNILHSGFLRNITLIIGYKKAILIEIIKSWKCAFILPIVSFFTFIISSICYHNNKILPYIETDGYPFQLVNDFMETMNPYVFMLIYFIILILFGVFIINIGLCVSRYLKKFYLVPIGSFIIFILIENVNNLLIAPLISHLTGIEKMMNAFSLYNLYYFSSLPSLVWEFVYALILVFLSTGIVYYVYSQKENMVMEYD